MDRSLINKALSHIAQKNSLDKKEIFEDFYSVCGEEFDTSDFPSDKKEPPFTREEISKLKLKDLKCLCLQEGIKENNESGQSGSKKLRELLISLYSEKYPGSFDSFESEFFTDLYLKSSS